MNVISFNDVIDNFHKFYNIDERIIREGKKEKDKFYYFITIISFVIKEYLSHIYPFAIIPSGSGNIIMRIFNFRLAEGNEIVS